MAAFAFAVYLSACKKLQWFIQCIRRIKDERILQFDWFLDYNLRRRILPDIGLEQEIVIYDKSLRSGWVQAKSNEQKYLKSQFWVYIYIYIYVCISISISIYLSINLFIRMVNEIWINTFRTCDLTVSLKHFNSCKSLYLSYYKFCYPNLCLLGAIVFFLQL